MCEIIMMTALKERVKYPTNEAISNIDNIQN